MRKFRNKHFIRPLAATMILILLGPVFLPTVSLALTHGPHQPEYTSYEEPGATDMVNLLTGDFSFNMPILEVPGPEGGFSLPLSYASGIGLDQEASWVGLGWSMNAGAITRSIVEYPDDAKGETFVIHRGNDDVERGWRASIPAIGQIGWNNNVGHHGTISILGLAGASYSNGSLSGGNLVGVHFNSKNVTVDPVGVAMAIMTIMSMGATAAAAEGAKVAGALLKDAAVSAGMEAAMTAAVGVPVPDFNIGGYWKLSQRKENKLFYTNYWVWLDQTRYEDMYGTFYLGDMPTTASTEVTPRVRGPIQPGSMVTTYAPLYVEPSAFGDQGAASDMHYHWDGRPYEKTVNPTSIAKDQFSVMGAGVSGSIEPYRLDVGSLAMPRLMTEKHKKIAIGKFLSSDDYKVQFKYKGILSNNYFHHVGGVKNGSAYDFDLEGDQYGIVAEVANQDPNINEHITYKFSDPILSVYDTDHVGNLIESDRSGLNDAKLAQSLQVEWYTHEEILNGTAEIIDCFKEIGGRSDFMFAKSIFPNVPIVKVTGDNFDQIYVGKDGVKHFKAGSFGDASCKVNIEIKKACIDGLDINITEEKIEAYVISKGTDYIKVQFINEVIKCSGGYSTNIFTKESHVVSNLPLTIAPHTIGGFTVRNPNGLLYHYSLPVYDYNYLNYMQNKDDEDDITFMNRVNPFPNTWLLTAITGVDYVDRGPDGPDGILNEYDWGKWIKFSYGKTIDDYNWRLPYKDMLLSSDNSNYTYTSGQRQQYYLNTIETRSHVALFIKSKRNDGKEFISMTSGVLPGFSRPAESLKLDEIVLLEKSDYLNLQNNYNFSFSNEIWDQCKRESLKEVLDPSDINNDIRDYIENNLLKKIKFNYSYDLCPGTLNSFTLKNSAGVLNCVMIGDYTGKLTLESVSTYGRNGFKVIPDYEFSYSNNKNYHPNRWDGWGMYTIESTTRTATNEGVAWNLTSIKNPLGSVLSIEYERDDYAHIAGQQLDRGGVGINSYYNPGFWEYSSNKIFISGGDFKTGDNVYIKYNVNLYPTGQCQEPAFNTSGAYYTTVTSVSNDGITVQPKAPFPMPEVIRNCPSWYPSGGTYGSITKVKDINKKGDKVRVAAISTQDDDNKVFKTRYLYTSNADGLSSGVVAKEPNNYNSGFDKLFDWPFTPVLYGTVTVLNGVGENDSDYLSKQVYQFETPDISMIKLNETFYDNEKVVKRRYLEGNSFIKKYLNEKLTTVKYTLDINTSTVGRIKSVTTYDNSNQIIGETNFNYTDNKTENDHLGVYTEGSIMIEKFDGAPNIEEGDVIMVYDNEIHRASRTTKRYYPSVLKSVTSTKDGFVSKTINNKWDFITGNVTNVISEDPMGLKFETVTVPAYHVYPDMGPVTVSSNNSHMLSQQAESYTYMLDDNNSRIGLFGAGVQTWKKDWNNYREFASGAYQDSDTENHAVWRKSGNYFWKGDLNHLNANGSYSLNNFSPFEYETSINPGWQTSGQIVRYDHYSMPVEVMDGTGIYSSIRMGHDHKRKIVEAGAAAYHEMTYCGAEDYNLATGYLEGEVSKGNVAAITATKTHTGNKAIMTSANSKGFIYKMDASGITEAKHYRLMVWAHETNISNAKLYYKKDNADPVYISYDPAMKSGEWYLLHATFPLETNTQTLEVGCYNSGGGEIYFDDFRFQPLQSGSVAYVYDEHGNISHMLNNDNLYTRYVRNKAGQIEATYVEVIDPHVREKIISSTENNYRGEWGFQQ